MRRDSRSNSNRTRMLCKKSRTACSPQLSVFGERDSRCKKGPVLEASHEAIGGSVVGNETQSSSPSGKRAALWAR